MDQNCNTETVGNYPNTAGPDYSADVGCTPDASLTVDATAQEVAAVEAVMAKDGYSYSKDNCIDRCEQVMDVLGISNPNFDTSKAGFTYSDLDNFADFIDGYGFNFP